MKELASTSEMLVNFYQTTPHNNPEDSHLDMPHVYELFGMLTFTLSHTLHILLHCISGIYTVLFITLSLFLFAVKRR
jgi:hypothetical protein